MAKNPSLPAYLTKGDIQKLIEACEKFYAVELLGEGYQGYLVTSWAVPSLGYSWKNSREFFKEVSALTLQDNIKDVYAVLAGWERQAPLNLPSEGAEGLSETVPRNLKELEEALDRAKSEQEKATLINSYQFLKSEAPPEVLATARGEAPSPTPTEKAATATQVSTGPSTPSKKAPSPDVRAEAPGAPTAEIKAAASSEPLSVGINITPEAGRVFQKFTNRVASLPVRAAIAWAAPTIAAEQSSTASAALTLWAMGIPGAKLEEKAPELKEAKEFNNLVRAVKGLETSFSLQTRIIQRAYPLKKIDLLLKAGVPQAQVDIFFNAPSAGVATAVPRRSFLENIFVDAGKQLFGKASSKALAKLGFQKTVSKALGPVVEKVTTAVVGWVIGWLASKLPNLISWLKRNAKEFGIAAIALLGAGVFFSNPLLLVSGLGLGAISLGAGGVGSIGTSVAGFGQAVLGGLTSMVLPAIGIPILVGLLSIPVVVAIILFIINSGAYVVPPVPFDVISGFPINCTSEKEALPFANNSSSPIARRAWKIVSDQYQGFWCYWNRSPGDLPTDIVLYPPSYPELFDLDWFRREPNPVYSQNAPIRNCWNCLFWCTQLVQKSFKETGNANLTTQTLNSGEMQRDFSNRRQLILASRATPQNVVSGSAIFFDGLGNVTGTDHVAIVYSVSEDAVVFIQTNAGTKTGSVPFNSSGVGLQNLPGINVVAIGLP